METHLHQFDARGPYLRYCGTVFMPAVHASEHSFMEFFEQTHPRLLGGQVVLRAHSPHGHPALFNHQPHTESCLDVWVACREDNPGIAAAIPLRHVEQWRVRTQAIRNDALGQTQPPPRRRRTPALA